MSYSYFTRTGSTSEGIPSGLTLRRCRGRRWMWGGEREKEVVPARPHTRGWEGAGWGMQRYRHDSTHGWEWAGWGMQWYRHDPTHGWEGPGWGMQSYRHDSLHSWEGRAGCGMQRYRHDFTHRCLPLPRRQAPMRRGGENSRSVQQAVSTNSRGEISANY